MELLRTEDKREMTNEINTSEGYICLYRKFLKWEWYDDANTMRVFIHCLLSANHTDNKWRGIVVKQGSFITSIGKLAHSLNLTIQQVRTSLNKLKSTNEITSKGTSSYTIIELNNWNLYQANNKQDNKRATNEQQTNNKRVTTNNNDNNDNNEKNENISLEKKTKPKIDPYINPIKTFFEQEYKKVFNKRCYLSNSNCNKLVELSSEIENIRELIPTVLKKLKQINWKDIDFNPDTSWLLKGDNFISVLNGEHDKKKTPEELRKIARDSEVERTKAKLDELEQIEGTAPEDSETWKELGRKLKRV